MSGEEDCLEFESENRLKLRSAVRELDAYISREERRCGSIIDSDVETTRCRQPKIIKSLTELKSALNRDRHEMKEGEKHYSEILSVLGIKINSGRFVNYFFPRFSAAYQFLKKSNETMKKIIGELRAEMKVCRVNIKNEFVNVENLNTERLLSINPKCFTAGTARRK